ncbi:hypothetical protein JOC76_005894 [Neobacillus cucumis]|nr:hypothetical protein [Neobacillus cucumis]
MAHQVSAFLFALGVVRKFEIIIFLVEVTGCFTLTTIGLFFGSPFSLYSTTMKINFCEIRKMAILK